MWFMILSLWCLMSVLGVSIAQLDTDVPVEVPPVAKPADTPPLPEVEAAPDDDRIPPPGLEIIAGRFPFADVYDARDRLEMIIEDMPDLGGVNGVGIDKDGIHIIATKDPKLPPDWEGIPIRVTIDPNENIYVTNHTYSNFLPATFTPGYGAMDEAAVLQDIGVCTAGPVVMAHGHPFFITSGHCVFDCDLAPKCTTTLDTCTPVYEAGTRQWDRSPVANPRRVGVAVKWYQYDNIGGGTTEYDLAAIAMNPDDDFSVVSLPVTRNMYDIGPEPYWGVSPGPILNEHVWMVSSVDSFTRSDGQTFTAFHPADCRVTDTLIDTYVAYIPCLSSQIKTTTRIANTFRYDCSPSRSLPGSSGSALVGRDSGHRGLLEGSHFAGNLNLDGTPGNLGRGIKVPKIKSFFGLVDGDFYTQGTYLDSTFGSWRDGSHQWIIDNGNGKLDPTWGTAPDAAHDQSIVWGRNGDLPITGDWDGSGTTTMGLYHLHTASDPDKFDLSNRNDCGCSDVTYNLGQPPANNIIKTFWPLAGKWKINFFAPTHSNVGIFNSFGPYGPYATGTLWYLDNGNWVQDASCSDSEQDFCFLTSWTRGGDVPVTGDWNGDGTVTLGVYRPSTGQFLLSNTPLYPRPTTITLDVTVPWGGGNDLPVVGWWDGKAATKVGSYRWAGGTFYLDTGLTGFQSCAWDLCRSYFTDNRQVYPVTFGTSVVAGE